MAIVLACGRGVFAQTAPAQPVEPFQILDNSFFVEEAFNQERGIVQNIFGVRRQGGEWQLSFTQEWPAPAQRHQLSYTVSGETLDAKLGWGDVYLNYRFQALEEGPGRPAFSPRFSVILPSGRTDAGGGESGIQVNLPFSKQHGDFYFHWNGGVTWVTRGERDDLVTPSLAGSVIYRLRPMLNLMAETVINWVAGDAAPGGIEHPVSFTLSPGLRGGWTVAPDTQLILGAAIPITHATGETTVGIFGYLSYELPFRK